MNNLQLQAAYRLGQQAAMEKVAISYDPKYSPADIDAIRRYNRDVASGRSTLTGVLGGLAAGAAAKYLGGASPLAAAGIGLGTGLLGKGLSYYGNRMAQGYDNYLHTDVNSQASKHRGYMVL